MFDTCLCLPLPGSFKMSTNVSLTSSFRSLNWTNQTGRILFKTQRSFSVPSTKEAKPNDELEPKVAIDYNRIVNSTKQHVTQIIENKNLFLIVLK